MVRFAMPTALSSTENTARSAQLLSPVCRKPPVVTASLGEKTVVKATKNAARRQMNDSYLPRSKQSDDLCAFRGG